MPTGQEYRWTLVLASLALIAFAANSVLCRLALGGSLIDATGFSAVRLTSGAFVLSAISFSGRRTPSPPSRGNWTSAVFLFLYAAAFSFAYQTLSTGTGALILFGSVQATMMITAVLSGERPHAGEWTGLAFAVGGLLYLVFPGLTAPSPEGAFLMVMAGIAWGLYTLRGRGISDPLAVTAGNFARTLPFVLLLCVVFLDDIQLSVHGAVLAAGSGAFASGLGYAVWYAALKGLTSTRASIIQLAVPVLAAAGGVLFLAEEISLRLVISALLILGGIALAVRSRVRQPATPRLQ